LKQNNQILQIKRNPKKKKKNQDKIIPNNNELVVREIVRDKNGECLICFENKAESMLLPCEHQALCGDCAISYAMILIDKCPICSAIITGYKSKQNDKINHEKKK